jgi:hypothetical protein
MRFPSSCARSGRFVEHLIRRLRHIVQNRLLRSVRWADIPQLSTRDQRCPAAWQQYWQQSRRTASIPDRMLFRRSGLPVRLTRSKRGRMLSCVDGRGWLPPLLSSLLSAAQTHWIARGFSE